MRVAILAKWVFGLLAAFFIALSSLIVWIVLTESGTSMAWRIASNLVPGLHAEQVKGRLVSGLLVEKLAYQSDSIALQLDEAYVNWSFGGPLYSELLVSKLALSDMSVTLLNSENSYDANDRIDLPVRLPLPISIVLADVEIVNFLLFSEPGSTPVEINNGYLRGKVESERVAVSSLILETPTFSLSGSLKTLVSKNYQTDADLSWSIHLPDLPATTGTLVLKGDQEKLDYRLLADASVDNYGDLVVDAAGVLSLSTVKVNSLAINHVQTPASISLDGWLAFAESEPNGELNIEWTGLQWPLVAADEDATSASTSGTQHSWVRSPSGKLTLLGAINGYSAALDASIATISSLDGRIQLAANGDTSSIEVNEIYIRALNGLAKGTAKANWSDQLVADLQLEGSHFNPGEIFPEWPGDINFSISARHTGSLTSIDQLIANGLLRDEVISLDTAVSHDGLDIAIPRLALRAGASRISVKGKIAEKMSMEWHIHSPDLGELFPDAGGSVESSGQLAGELPWPVLQAELTATDLYIASHRVGRLDLAASVEPFSDNDFELKLEASEIFVSDVAIDSVQLLANGTRMLHEASLGINSSTANASLHIEGGWNADAWRGVLSSGELSIDSLPGWKLNQPQSLYLDAQRQLLKPACWISTEASLCLEAERNKADVSGNIRLTELPLSYFKPLLGSMIEIQGHVSGSAEFGYSESGLWSVNGDLKSSPASLAINSADGQAAITLAKLEPGELNFQGDEKTINTRLSLPIAGGGGAQSRLEIDHSGKPISLATLTGDVLLSLPDIKVLSVLSQEIQPLAGQLMLDMTLSGTPRALRPVGKLTLNNARLNLKTPGLALTDLSVTGTGGGDGQISYSGTASSGDGSLDIVGSSSLVTELPHTDIHLKGSNFQVWSTADAKVTASPDLRIVVSDQLIDVKGNVTIPSAQITPQELPSGTVSPSADQVIVSSSKNTDADSGVATPRDISVEVNLTLGSNVQMQGFGFKGRMEGELAIAQPAGSAMVASGELKVIDGEYRAYGQGLIIDRGQVLFAGGAIENPGISVRALRRPVPEIVVGVNVSGELRQPEVGLFSEPNMSQAEQLSWLVLGRSIQNSSGAENDYITQAALFLGMKGGNFLTKNIGQTVGLDSIGFEAGSTEAGASNDVNQAALVLGKYLTPKLYVSYGIGLLDSLSTVKLRYSITDRWNLVTESSAIASGGDISYSFEK